MSNFTKTNVLKGCVYIGPELEGGRTGQDSSLTSLSTSNKRLISLLLTLNLHQTEPLKTGTLRLLTFCKCVHVYSVHHVGL